MSESQQWGQGILQTSIGAAVWNARTVLVTDWSSGSVHAFTIEQGEHTDWGDGYQNPEGIAVHGDEALIVEQAGVLLRQDLNNPGRAGAVEVATGLGTLHAVVWDGDSPAHLTDYSGGRILSVHLDDGSSDVVAAG